MDQLRFAPIIRVSTEKQKKKGESLNTQTSQIKDYVSALNGVIPPSCWKYKGQESGMASEKERELLNQLLIDSSKGLFDAVICVDPSRWSRDNQKSKEGLEILRKNNIRFFVGAMEYDLYDPTHIFYLGMNAEINELTVNIGSLKSIQNRIERAKQGIPSTGNLPWGRTFDKKTNKWGLDPDKEALIKKAADRFVNGDSFKDIANTYGMSHNTLYKVLSKSCGDTWEARFRYEKGRIDETVTFTIDPLLEPEMIKKVHARIAMNKTARRGNRKYDYLLIGYLFCEDCNYRFRTVTNQQGYQHYTHRNTPFNEHCKVKGGIKAKEIESAVFLDVITTMGDPERIEAAIQRATPDLGKIKDLTKELKGLEKDLKLNTTQKDRVISMVASGTLNEVEVSKQIKELREAETAISERITAISSELSNLPDPKRIKNASQLSVSVARHLARDPELIFNMSHKKKRAIIEKAFSGTDASGKPLGVYVKKVEGKWQFEIRGAFENTVKSLPMDDWDLITHFKLDTDQEREVIDQKLNDIRSKLYGGGHRRGHL